jgi:hypothetical protein
MLQGRLEPSQDTRTDAQADTTVQPTEQTTLTLEDERRSSQMEPGNTSALREATSNQLVQQLQGIAFFLAKKNKRLAITLQWIAQHLHFDLPKLAFCFAL